MTQIHPDFIRALTNIEDGIVAQQYDEPSTEDISTFETEARRALDGFPDTYPYIEHYRQTLSDHNFKNALSALKELAIYVSEADTESEEVEVSYNEGAIERIIDAEPTE